MRNLLQDKLLKAGLVQKSKVDQVVREQAKQRQGKSPTGAALPEVQVSAQQLQEQRAQRDRALALEHKEQQRVAEVRAQIRQIIDTHKLARNGEIAYRFTDGAVIKSLLVDAVQRTRLAKGLLAIARLDADQYELLPREAADKVRARDPAVIVLDHAQDSDKSASEQGGEDDYYQRFLVPDDLIW